MGGRSRRGSTVSRSTSISLRRSFLTPGLNRDQYLSIRPISDIHHRSPSGRGAKFFLTKTATRPEGIIGLPQARQTGAGEMSISGRRCHPEPALGSAIPTNADVSCVSFPCESPHQKCLLLRGWGLPGIRQENPKLIAFGIPSEELKSFIQAR